MISIDATMGLCDEIRQSANALRAIHLDVYHWNVAACDAVHAFPIVFIGIVDRASSGVRLIPRADWKTEGHRLRGLSGPIDGSAGSELVQLYLDISIANGALTGAHGR
jgi:hypothetical protein